jgi:hypothetical protein
MADDALGYNVCQGGDVVIGDGCSDATECASGFCKNDVCAGCDEDVDCAGAQTCELDNDLGYHVCVGGEVVLGEACNEGAECASGFCKNDTCATCEEDQDCDGALVCVSDETLGYFDCQRSAAALGEDCSAGLDCSSGFCNSQVCSQCESNQDCGQDQTCVLSERLGYHVCEGALTDLGQQCSVPEDCDSSFCTDEVCSECTTNRDCDQANTECVADFALGYFICQEIQLLQLGEQCGEDQECESGICHQDVCSECQDNGDCDGAQECVEDNDLGYFVCQGGDVVLGDGCNDGAECASGYCNNDVCSECENNWNCEGNEECTADFDLGYFTCSPGELSALGEVCAESSECDSGFCWDTPVGPNICSECENDTDCNGEMVCSYTINADVRWATCTGNTPLGEACQENGECVSGFCHPDVCSECAADENCFGDGSCTDDTEGVGYFICQGGLGDSCQTSQDCNSEFCYIRQGPGGGACSECEENQDCDNNLDCEWSMLSQHAVCR